MKLKNTDYSGVTSLVGILLFVVVFLCSCDDKKEELKTAPTVATGAVSNITVLSADLSAVVTDDGNAVVSELGFVYSSVVAQPTVADNKIKVTSSGNSF